MIAVSSKTFHRLRLSFLSDGGRTKPQVQAQMRLHQLRCPPEESSCYAACSDLTGTARCEPSTARTGQNPVSQSLHSCRSTFNREKKDNALKTAVGNVKIHGRNANGDAGRP
jgi:hypothetical protein